MSKALELADALECVAKYRETGGNDLMKAVTELRRLAAEVESLKLDAARYRWLRLPDSVLPISTEQARNPELYDAVIDAKMAKENPHG